MVLGDNCKLICSSLTLSSMRFNRRMLLWCLVLMAFVLLNGCSTTARRDGPPPFDVDVSNIPNAKPKKEPLAKYGNMSTYRVFGQNYYVMKSAKHYRERGVASWYGTMFHAQRTSSGEPYNMLAMTAAHKTLPLPTYVEVTNLHNHKKIIVKVNDRGPFASNRIIDLSYVAAKKLGMLGHGTAYVEVKSIDPADAYKQRHLWAHNKVRTNKLYAANSSSHSVYIQVGAFKNRLHAEKLRQRLAPWVTSPIEITQLAHPANSLYRVKIGPIRDIATADTIKKKLRAIGLTPKHIKV